MKMKNITLIFLFWFVPALVAHSQESALDTLAKRFNTHRENTYQEKIYAHIDRNFYLTGEILWFKLYVVDGAFHKPAELSKVAYVEMLDRSGLAVLQAKVELEKGVGNGSLFIPASVSSGNYRFRAYTSWMKNFPPEFYYSQTVSIANPFAVTAPARPDTPTACHIDFFPEGGNLVSAIPTKIGFKVASAHRDGHYCNGVIIDENRDTVATFSPGKTGIGHFHLRAFADKKYKAIISDAGAKPKEVPFPEIQPRGYAMQLRDSGEYIRIAVRSIGMDEGMVYLFSHARQIIAHAEGKNLSRSAAFFSVRKDDLAEGISHFTLFNSDLQPVCERLYFTYPRNDFNIEINTNQKIYSPRRKAIVSLRTTEDALPTAADLSLSVYRVDSLSSMNPMSIKPYLLLGSDLTGTIQSPGYYFEGEEHERSADVDNLMLTHGWRRFNWDDIMAQKKTDHSFLPEVREHIVSAVITRGGEKTRGVFTHLGSPGKIIRAYGSWSDDNGEVRFEIKDFYGPRRIILQTKTDTSGTYDINIRDPFSPFRMSEELPPLKLKAESKDALLARSIAMQVQDVYYYEKFGDRIIQPAVDSSAFYGQADATYLLDDYTRFPVMEEVMREYVPGVFVRKRKDGFHFVLVDQVYGGVLRGDPMVLVDGVPVLDVDDIMSMDPLRVRKLEVVKRPYYLGQSVFFGIVSYTTYRGDLGGLELDPKSVSLNYDGLQLKREFHKPQYSRDQQNDRMPDERHLLHWEPYAVTDIQGKRQLEFFTSDVPGNYVIIAEGISPEGHAGTTAYTFQVTVPGNQ